MKQQLPAFWLIGCALACVVEARSAAAQVGGDDSLRAIAPGVRDSVVRDRPDAAPTPWAQQFGLQFVPLPQARFAALDAPALLAEDDRTAQMLGGGPLRVSINSPCWINLAQGQWFNVPDGRLWMIEVVFDEAPGGRLHFSGLNLPAGAEIVMYAPDFPDEPALRVDGAGPLGSGEFWSQTVRGARARVEYFVPEKAGKGPEEPFVIDEVTQLYRDVFAVQQAEGGIAGAGPCHNDPACFAAWANISDAVAKITYISGGSGFECSGQLIATVAADLTPYFVTAYHCISTAPEANSAEVRWKYRRLTCGGSISSGVTANFCSLVNAYCVSDETLLMVEGTLPAGLFWAGWATSSPSSGTAITSLHHPAGTHQRISFGTKGNTPQNCIGACANGSANYALVTFNSGVTEPGSSGGGVFRNDNQLLVGTISCGGSSCTNPNVPDTFGRFDRSYTSANWNGLYLQAGSDDSFEPNNSCLAAATISTGMHNNLIVKSLNEDWYKINIPGGTPMTFTATFIHGWGDINLQLYAACGGPVIASSSGFGNSETITYTNSGATANFFLRVYLASDVRNDYDLNIAIPPPANNACASAITVGAGTTNFTTLGATTDGPNEPGLCSFGGYTQIDNDVWFRILAPCSGDLTVSLCGATFNAKMALYGSACPTSPNTALGCSDDSCGNAPQVTIPVTSSQPIRIRIGGFMGATGSGTMSITCGQPPPQCPADVNGDNTVNFDDILAQIGMWGPCTGCAADVNGDGVVNFDDVLACIQAWGPCP